jgi:hypothetical protein
MEVFCFHNFEDIEWWSDKLAQLSQASRRPDPFSTFTFLKNHAAHPHWYPGDAQAQLWFLLAVESGRPVGYLALRRTVPRVLGVESPRLEFFVTHDNDCPQLVARPEDAARVSAAFYRYLFSRKAEWALLDVHQQDPGSALTPPPADDSLRDYYLRIVATRENHTLALRWPSFDAYFKALGSKFRSDVRRKARKLLAAGRVSWLSSDDPRSTPALLELVRAVEARSWKSEHEIALDSHPDRLAYYRGMLSADQEMRIRISVLLLDGIPISAAVNGEYAGTVYGLMIVHDDRVTALSPSVLLLALMIRDAIERKLSAYDMLGGFSYYKARWLAEETPTRSGQLFRFGSPWYWKAMLGALKREVLGSLADLRTDFNPDRREATEAREADAPSTLNLGEEERQRIEAVCASLEGLPVNRLGPEQITAAIPWGEAGGTAAVGKKGHARDGLGAQPPLAQ